jgi:hypothetical protein
MAEYVELYIDQGADFESTLVLEDDVTNLLQNVSSYVVTGTMRRSLLSQNASGILSCAINANATGEILMTMNAANTANLRPGTHLFDVKTFDGSKYNRLIEGIIIVTPSITK